MKLIIAEKPSVATSIAAAIGTPIRRTGYIEAGDSLVSWCIGHLVELAYPEAYDPEFKAWRLDTLPIIPSRYLITVSKATAAQFKTLQSLMERSDVDELIEATDAGREGELIFRLVYQKTGCKKPFRRLWISSVEPAAIRAGMDDLQPSAAYDALFSAAQCRQRADWLLGINLTRLYTTMYGTRLPYGRVQTPTVNLIVQRQADIDNFVPQKYYSICANLGSFRAYAQADRRDAALHIVEQCAGAEAVITKLQEEQKQEKPPALYDLTALQRDANRLYGYTAQQTLDTAQGLYERALITYPRTDSRYLTSDQQGTAADLVKITLKCFNVKTLNSYNDKTVNISQIIDDKKVSDHHAILPTKAAIETPPEDLPTTEKNILFLLQQRLIAAVFPPHIYEAVSATFDIEGYPFKATGRREIDPGWRGIVQPDNPEDDSTENMEMPPIAEGNSFAVRSCTMKECKTKPAAAYTEDTLLKAMETAGQDIDDPTLREAMKNRGLGTPATRAGIIESIIKSGYIQRSGKKLLPTAFAKKFIELVDDRLKSPMLTAEWEQSLADIQHSVRDPESFMREIEGFLRLFVEEAKELHLPEDADTFREVIGICPYCGKAVYETPKAYSCEGGKGCGFALWKEICQVKISPAQAKKVIEKGKSDVIRGFVAKSGKSFNARLVLDTTKSGIKFEFE